MHLFYTNNLTPRSPVAGLFRRPPGRVRAAPLPGCIRGRYLSRDAPSPPVREAESISLPTHPHIL